MLSLSVQLFKVLTWVALFFLISGATICPGRGLSPAARREEEREKESAKGSQRYESTRGRATPPNNNPKPTPFTHFSITMALRLLTFRGLWKLALYTASSPGHGWVLLLLLG